MISNYKDWRLMEQLEPGRRDLKCRLLRVKEGTDNFNSLIATVQIDGEDADILVRQYADDILEFLDVDEFHLENLENLQWYRWNVDETRERIEEIRDFVNTAMPFKSDEFYPLLSTSIVISDVKLGVINKYTDYIFKCPILGNETDDLTFRFDSKYPEWPDLLVDGYILPMSPDQDDIHDTYGEAIGEVLDNIGEPDNRFAAYQ
jgi:hypothetical protein